jgi:hypothetical protein
MSGNVNKIRVALIGLGKGGSILLSFLISNKRFELIGVSDNNPEAVGVQMARDFNVPVYLNYLDLIKRDDLDLIVEVTRDSNVYSQIIKQKNISADVIGGKSARFIWSIISQNRQRYEKIYDAGLMLISAHKVAEVFSILVTKAAGTYRVRSCLLTLLLF